ncbi:acyl-CoA dehydrogenase [Alicycliphilus denitrificans]|uniref:acyl-CoA dehydrogenase family protein n=1 Tax=Alicycliphilus denitrificans TaxID=179636 RepID=UPI00095A2409|nr:acyl-CoA dehydrogenase [Alicycliphilus denitrificans]MBN9572561.1 acyl-CoA dehydrogenase family protein [Alicycliphilus denitrificans]OJW91642.1 MAG: acyl-CoA dehydrogenase [Alicycliphilus sp. 69-12]BCN37677.1 acyl-CoA dehydrogenase [Alicycliphilus denitrificans]
MDFTYSEEQRMLADSLRRFVESEYTFEKRRKNAREQGSFDRSIWSSLAEMGVLGLGVSAEHGGFSHGPASQVVVQRELGRALLQEPVIPSGVIAATILAQHATTAQQAEWLPAIASGDKIFTLAYLEPDSRYSPEAARTVARKCGADRYALNGRKSVVWHGAVVDMFLVSARLDGELALFLVGGDAPGLTVKGYPTIDRLSAADLELIDVPATLVTTNGIEAVEIGLDHGIAAQCAAAAGAIERLIEITVEYLSARKQFGKPLASFQTLQHRVADMLLQQELALSMAYVAAQGLDASDVAERRRKVSAAKVVTAKAARFVGQQAVQLHGGMGMTDEVEVGDYFKALTMVDVLLGDTDLHLERYGEAMVA